MDSTLTAGEIRQRFYRFLQEEMNTYVHSSATILWTITLLFAKRRHEPGKVVSPFYLLSTWEAAKQP